MTMVITSNWLSAAMAAFKEPEVVWPEVEVDRDFEVPYPEQMAVFHPTERTIAFLSTAYDECCHENPLGDWDESGSIHSFGHRHHNYWKTVAYCDTYEELKEALDDEFGKDWVPLGYFEHGQCDWHVSGELKLGMEGDYRWDGVQFAGVWVPDEGLLGYCEGLNSKERADKLYEYARQACAVYTQWLNGDVYGYMFDVYTLRFEGEHVYDRRDDYRIADELYHDSCWGFYGWDHLEEEAKSEVNWFLDNKLEEFNESIL